MNDRLKRVRASCFFLIAKFVLVVRCKTGRYKRLQLQQCSFYGPAEFLSVCLSAMTTLSQLDKPLYESLVKGRYVFWHEPAGIVFFKEHCGIPDSYLAWKERGIIACIVHSYFVAKLAYGDPPVSFARDEARLVDQEIWTNVQAWLDKHEFPLELVSCFHKGAMTARA